MTMLARILVALATLLALFPPCSAPRDLVAGLLENLMSLHSTLAAAPSQQALMPSLPPSLILLAVTC